MGNIFFIGDMHLGHKGILNKNEKRSKFFSLEEMSEYIVESYNNRVTSKDTVYLLGDICMSSDSLKYLKRG